MCSIGDENIEDLENSKYMPTKEKPSILSKCNKCRTNQPIVLLRSKDIYCRECFLSTTVHKFKALLGKHKLIRPNDRVLVVHKCGHPSTALLHFIRTGLDLGTHKKLRFEPIVLFVEDCVHLSLKERRNLLEEVENEVVKFNLPLYMTSLPLLIKSDFIDTVLKQKHSLLELSEDDKSVIANFTSKQKNLTNQTDFLHIQRQTFFVQIAKHLNCNFIFTPEVSGDVASQILTDVSLGRGSQIVLNTGFRDFRHDVNILRPLRLHDKKELAFYNHLNNLKPVAVNLSIENPYKSIQKLMNKFVNDLQVNYPATVTTILKTSDKLASTGNETIRCELCNAPISKENSELNSAESTHFSHWISTQPYAESSTSQDRYSQTLEAFNNLICDSYCFSCKKLMK